MRPCVRAIGPLYYSRHFKRQTQNNLTKTKKEKENSLILYVPITEYREYKIYF